MTAQVTMSNLQRVRAAVYALYTEWQQSGNEYSVDYAEAITDALRVIDTVILKEGL